MAHPDHDQVIGRLVGARLRGAASGQPGDAGAAAAHPDAETWAAYVDGGLLPAEVSRMEDHLAGCGVCRRLVAALAPEVSAAAKPAVQEAVAPPAGRATVLPFPRRQLFAWMSVAAALFAAVTLWSVSRLGSDAPVSEIAVSAPVAQPAPPAAASSSSRLAQAELDQTAAAPAAPGRAEPGAATGAPAGGAVGTVAKAVAAPKPAEDKRLADAAPAPASPADARQIPLQTNTAAAGAARARGPLATQAATTQQNAPAGQAAPPAAPASAAPRAATQAPRAAPAAAKPTAEQASAAADARAAEARERRDADQQPGGVAEVATITGAAPPARAGRGQRAAAVGADRAAAAPSKDEAAKVASFAFAAAPAVFAEPGGRLQWRIAEGRRLESSSDGGTTWTARYTARGGRLRAGTAPAIDSAWAVGERGLVLRLSVPGGWAVAAPPADVTLIGVSATGAQSARVTAADGRVFETADGGATWTAATPGAGPP